MKPRLSLSIRQKLLILSAVCLAGVGSLAGTALYFSGKVERAAQAINQQRFAPLSHLQDLSGRLKEVRFRLAGVLLDQMPIPGSRNQLKETMDQAPTQWKEFKEAVGELGTERQKLVADIDKGMPELDHFSAALEKAYAASDKKALEGLLEDQWPIVQQKVVKPLDGLLPALSGAVAEDTKAVETLARHFSVFTAGAALAIVLATLVIAFLITRAISAPLRRTGELLDQIGAGKLDNVIDTTRGDEVGQLLCGVAAAQSALRERAAAEQRHAAEQQARAEADRRALGEVQEIVAAVVDGDLDRRLSINDKNGFAAQLAASINGLVENVAGVVSGVQRIVDGANGGDLTQRIQVDNRSGLERRIGTGINQLVEDMGALVAKAKEAAEDVSRGSLEISQGNSSLSRRTEDQAASLEETAASMEEMTSTVKQNADNARQANALAIDARSRAEQGGASVASAVRAMEGINASSKKIADIIGVIDEIAFQTNLLALNAAVEAARAGDQGRGFAVVASEVRNLASRSAGAAKEIKALIKDSVGRVEDGTRLVTESGTTLDQLVSAVKKVGDIIAEISSASDEQASGIDQVGQAITQMDELTQQNAALVEEAAAASKNLADRANDLNGMLNRYRVSTDARTARSVHGDRVARISSANRAETSVRTGTL